MPDVWAKAFAPTMALLGCTTIPVILLTKRLVFGNLFGSNLGVRLIQIRSGAEAHHNLFQGRISRPFADSIDRAFHLARPFIIAAKLFATANPRSLWQWTEITACSALGTLSQIP